MKYVALLAFACGAAKPAGPSASDPVKKWLDDTIAGIERGEATVFDGRVEPDGAFIGVAFADAWDGTDFVAAQTAMLGGHKGWHIKSDKLVVAHAPDGKSAWFTDLMTWDEGHGPQPIRWTGVLVAQGGQWLLSASHASIGMKNETAAIQAGEGQMPSLKAVPAKVDPDAQVIVEMFDRDLASTPQWLTDTSMRDDAIVIGSDPAEVWTGPAQIKKGFDDDTAHHATIKRTGDARAHVVGQLAWLAANVQIEVGTGKPLPMRLLAVYVREDAGWKMVQLHASTASLTGASR